MVKNNLRKAVVHGPTIAAVVLIGTFSLYFWIEPKSNIKLEKIIIEDVKNEKKY